MLLRLAKPSNKLFKKRCQNVRWICISLCVIGLLLCISPSAYATDPLHTAPSDTADIVVDGRPVFQIETSGSYSAQQRATQANRQLAKLARSSEKPKIRVVEHNQQPILLANDQYLMTVTGPDTHISQSPLQQARVWAKQLERSLHGSQLERSPSHTREMLLLTSLTLLMTVTLHLSLGYIWRRTPRYATADAASTAASSEPQDTNQSSPQSAGLLFTFNLALVRFGVWAIALSHISSLFPTLRQKRYSLFNDVKTGIHSPMFDLGHQTYTLIDIILLLGLMAGLFMIVRTSTRVLSTHVLKKTPLARGSREVITQSFRYGAFSLGMLLLMQIWGIDLRSVALLGSALGIGIGFGLQDIAKNFGSGLVLLFERSVQVGDFIEIATHQGTVERIGARSITLRTLDNISVLVPNAHLLDSQVINWNHDHPVSRLHLVIGTAYAANPRLVKSLLLQAAEENAEVLPTPAPNVFLKNFGDSAIEFDLMVWIRDPERHAAIRSALNFRIEEILNQHEISIPFPQRDVNLRIISDSADASADAKEALREVFKTSEPVDTVSVNQFS